MKMVDFSKLKELDEQIKARYPEYAVLDGIVSEDEFNNITPKILWILKESNIVDLSIFKNGWWKLRDFLWEDITEYSKWKNTWGLVMEISDAIIHNAQNWYDDVPLTDKLKEEGVIKKIAVVNVKKTGGIASSDQREINSFYKKDKDIILAQIQAISPDIIINGSRVTELFNDIKTDTDQPIGPFAVAKSNSGIVINAFHPNQREISHEEYFKYIRDCIKSKA
jgi:hypothetical protein